MTRVDFYLLAEKTERTRRLFACRLIAKAYQKKHKIYISVPSEQAALELDQLLWSFSDASFIPHEIQSSMETSVPILIGTAPILGYDLLINLTSTLPDFFKDFPRIIEIIPNEQNFLESGRNNFRSYRKEGCQLESHSFVNQDKSRI